MSREAKISIVLLLSINVNEFYFTGGMFGISKHESFMISHKRIILTEEMSVIRFDSSNTSINTLCNDFFLFLLEANKWVLSDFPTCRERFFSVHRLQIYVGRDREMLLLLLKRLQNSPQQVMSSCICSVDRREGKKENVVSSWWHPGDRYTGRASTQWTWPRTDRSLSSQGWAVKRVEPIAQ